MEKYIELPPGTPVRYEWGSDDEIHGFIESSRVSNTFPNEYVYRVLIDDSLGRCTVEDGITVSMYSHEFDVLDGEIDHLEIPESPEELTVPVSKWEEAVKISKDLEQRNGSLISKLQVAEARVRALEAAGVKQVPLESDKRKINKLENIIIKLVAYNDDAVINLLLSQETEIEDAEERECDCYEC